MLVSTLRRAKIEDEFCWRSATSSPRSPQGTPGTMTCLLCPKIRPKIPGVLPEKLDGSAVRFNKPLPYFRPKSVIFPTQCQTWSKIWYPISDLKPWSPARDRSAWQAVRYVPRQRYGFLAVLVWNRVSISTILVWNRVWFVLELGIVFRRTSHFFIIWR